MAAQKIGKYEVMSTLGRGSMGVVYKAEDPEIGRIVAIKTLKSVFLGDDDVGNESMKRFRQESRSAGRLNHPNIVTIYEADKTDNGSPFIVMGYIDGESLQQLIAKSNGLNPVEALHYLSQIASAVDYAHSQNVIHRDIKPSNVLIDSNYCPHLLDFGVAKMSDTSLTPAGTVVGTPSYMSPEQIRGEDLDGRTDLFSLAVMAYEVFTGVRPFPGNDFTTVVGNIIHKPPHALAEVAPQLPQELESVLTRALAKSRDERYSSALEFIDALAQVFSVMVDGNGLIGGYREGMTLESLQASTGSQGGALAGASVMGAGLASPPEVATDNSINLNLPSNGDSAGSSEQVLEPAAESEVEVAANVESESVAEAGGSSDLSDLFGAPSTEPDFVDSSLEEKAFEESIAPELGMGPESDDFEDFEKGDDDFGFGEMDEAETFESLQTAAVPQMKSAGSKILRLGVVFISVVVVVAVGGYFLLSPGDRDDSEIQVASTTDTGNTDNVNTDSGATSVDRGSAVEDALVSANEGDRGIGGDDPASAITPIPVDFPAGKVGKGFFTGKEDGQVLFALNSTKASVAVKRQAIVEAGKRQLPGFLDSLVLLTNSPQYILRVEALKALSNDSYSTDKAAFNAILARIDDEQYLVRGFAAKLLGKIGGEGVVEKLERRLAIEENDRCQKGFGKVDRQSSRIDLLLSAGEIGRFMGSFDRK